VWVPSQIGISGNTTVDAVAKASVSLPILNAEISNTGFKPLVLSHVKNCWQLSWNFGYQRKALQNTARKQIICCQPSATYRDEILNRRMRVGHTYLNHSYLLRREIPPECDVGHVRV
jgi:hypothetical protein